MQKIQISTSKRCEFIDITDRIARVVKDTGSITVFVPHTTAAITVNEGYDPDVVSDMISKFTKLVPRSDEYAHAEGNSDSHIKTSMMGSSVTILVEDGQLQLGTWQKVFFCEFDGPRQREFWVQ